MRDWYAKNINWKGSAAELANLAQSLLVKACLNAENISPNERLVRNYMQLGILDRPERSGKEAYFGPRQVIEFLVARKLIQDGWPLAKIAEFTRTHEIDDLLDQFPDTRQITDAERLVAKLKAESQPSQTNQTRSIRNSGSPVSSSFLTHSAEWSKRKAIARDVLHSLGNLSGEPRRYRLVKLSIADWCEVLVDLEQLRKLPIESLDELGNTIAHLLREELQSTRRSS